MRISTGRAALLLLAIALTSILSSGCQTIATASAASRAALEEAARTERCAYAQHQGTEPPLMQADVFSSLFEQAHDVRSIAAAQADAHHAEYKVGFEYRTPGAAALCATP